MSLIPPADVTQVYIYNSKLAVLTSAFCDGFPNLESLNAMAQGIEIIRDNAFSQCRNLISLVLTTNQIKVLPENLFRQNPLLQMVAMVLMVAITSSGLIGITDNQFATNTRLQTLNLNNNQIADFPTSAVANCRELWTIWLDKNDLLDLDESSMILSLPQLWEVAINHNIIPCKRMEEIVTNFNRNNIQTPVFQTFQKKRIFQIGNYGNFSCMDGTCYPGQ